MKNTEMIEAYLLRVSPDHILDLYTGMDEFNKDCIVLVTCTVPTPENNNSLRSSQGIDVRVRQRSDNKYAIVISLQTASASDLFEKFKSDIIDSSSKLLSESLGLNFIARRYASWQRLFHSKGNGKLTLKEIKGLFGELIFLSKYMFNQYGFQKSLDSWTGIEGTDQDFHVDDIWYEVKTTTSGNNIIMISSIEQLDSNEMGYLTVIALDQTSTTDKNSLSIGGLIGQIKASLPSGLDEEFSETLLAHGYCGFDEYEQYHFKVNGLRAYKVDSLFPVLRRKDIKYSEIVNAVYQLDLCNLTETCMTGGNI